MLIASGPADPDSQIQKDKKILPVLDSKIQKGIKSLFAPDLKIQILPVPAKPLLEVFTAPTNPIVLYSPLPIDQPPVTITHAIPWVYQAPNQTNIGEVSNAKGFLGQPKAIRADCGARQNNWFQLKKWKNS